MLEDIVKYRTSKEYPNSHVIINLLGDTTDITRIFEYAMEAKIISSKTKVTEIVELFFNVDKEKLTKNYYKNRSELNKTAEALSTSQTFYNFTLLCANNLSISKRNKLFKELVSS